RVGQSVSPFAKRGLNEAFGLAIGLGRVGPGADVAQAEIAAGIAEVRGAIAGTIVGHHPGDDDGAAGANAAMRLRPRRLRMRLTVAGETPTSAAICLPVQRWRRNASTFSTMTAGVGLCRRRG